MTAEPIRAGVEPWFPGPLARWKWLTEPVPAERLAAFRIGLALVLLVDIGVTFLPYFSLLFRPDELGGNDLFTYRIRPGHWNWSALRWLPETWGPAAVFGGWVGAAVALLAGWRPPLSGLVCWGVAVSVMNTQHAVINGGDRLRNTALLVAALSACGAVWGVSAVRRNGRPVLAPGWPVKVLLVQLMVLYFFSGWYKVISPAWRSGYVMYWVSHDLAWATLPGLGTGVPVWCFQLLSWITLAWELGFPVLVLLPGTRAATLWVGVAFHLLTAVTLEVGPFALYAVACYLPLAPWEKWLPGNARGFACRGR